MLLSKLTPLFIEALSMFTKESIFFLSGIVFKFFFLRPGNILASSASSVIVSTEASLSFLAAYCFN